LGPKVKMVEHIAGGMGKVRSWAWCTDSDCDLGFLVSKARWTAECSDGAGNLMEPRLAAKVNGFDFEWSEGKTAFFIFAKNHLLNP
jgi:hypothetical protein